jgi:hypothetical protein
MDLRVGNGRGTEDRLCNTLLASDRTSQPALHAPTTVAHRGQRVQANVDAP